MNSVNPELSKRAMIITRPERSAHRTALQLRSMCSDAIEIVVSPLLEIVPLGVSVDLARGAALVLTSENAMRSVNIGLASREVTAFCIGNRTARTAEQAGFRVRTAANSSSSLVSMIMAEPPGGDLIYLRGRHVAADVAGMLRLAGVHAHEIVVYDQERRSLGRAANLALNRGACILPVFSARTAAILSEEASGIPDLGHTVCCLSQNVAEAFSLNWKCIVAEEATSTALLSLAVDAASG